MDERKVFGQYIVGQGKDFKMKKNKTHYGYDRTLDPEAWYIVHITGRVLGVYANETFAISLATGLDKRDHNKLAAEMDRILCEETEAPEGDDKK